MERLSREQLLAADDIVEQDVDVPAWGGSVRIRSLSMQQAANINRLSQRRDPRTGKDEQDQGLLVAWLLTEGLVEPKLSIADASALLGKSAKAVSVIVTAINEASGLSDTAVTEADKSNGTGPAPGVRVLPGSGIGDDDEPVAAEYVRP